MSYSKGSNAVGYNISGAARILGHSRKWTRDQIKAGIIPCVRLSDRVYVVPRAWVDNLAGKEIA